MADPSIVTIPANTWTVVATNVTAGTVNIRKTIPVYYQTYRDTGGAVPTDLTDAIAFDGQLQIAAAAAIDVYVYCPNDAGEVRVDL